MSSLAKSWSQRFMDFYGMSVPVADTCPDSNQNDVIIVFADDEASCFAYTQRAEEDAAILVLGTQEMNASFLDGLRLHYS